MKRPIGSVLAIVLASGVVSAGLAQAGGETSCKRIRAQIVDATATAGCTSPDNFCAAGTVLANHFLNGTTFFTLDGFARGPVIAPGFNSTSGVLVYTTEHGTLTVRETGISDISLSAGTGHGAAVQEILGGTGRFTGVTGHLELSQSPGAGKFISDVVGELCVRD